MKYLSMAAIPIVFGFFLCFFQVSVLGQETEPSWHWIMADSRNASLVCPGRCLAVNDSAYPGDYEGKEVGFSPCRSSSSDSTSPANDNQQWLYDGPGTPTRIRINASEAEPPVPVCLQPRRAPGSSHISLTVTKCSAESNKNQSWVVADDSIASLAFDPPLYLAMQYKLSADGTWRRASLAPKNDAGFRNKSLTNVFSMVAYTEDIRSFPPLNMSNMIADSDNFIQNGGFEQSSFDFRYNVTEFEINENELFGVCHWVVQKSQINLRDATRMPPAEGNRTLWLNDGIFMQRARTRPGAMYTLSFQMAVAKPDPSNDGASSGGSCNGTDTISVNAFPSTNVKVNLNSSSWGTWKPKHFSFQAVGNELQLTFMGCSACGCYLDEVNLMQTTDPAPLPPPPPFRRRPPPPPDVWFPFRPRLPLPLPPPPPPPNSSTKPEPPQQNRPDPRPPLVFSYQSSRLSNGAVAGLLVGSSVLFFLMGAACFGVVGLTKQSKPLQEVDMVRPSEWSIQTTTPPISEGRGGAQLSSSNAPPAPANPSPPSSNVETHSASSRP